MHIKLCLHRETTATNASKKPSLMKTVYLGGKSIFDSICAQKNNPNISRNKTGVESAIFAC